VTVDVSRETLRPPPDVAGQIFGASLPTAVAYARLLATDGVQRGLLGPLEVSRLWDRHLFNCAILAPLIAAESSVCDLGSGAGLPGMVLALMRPDLDMVLLEPLLRRTVFLEQAIEALGLGNVQVLRSRAEDLVGHLEVDVVTARAVAPLARLLGWALPLCAPNGQVLAMKGQSVDREIAEASAVLGREGVAGWDVVDVGAAGVASGTRVVRVRCGGRPAAAAISQNQ
jgi:16S rRNA (guanine527-N7)-methyltransferase